MTSFDFTTKVYGKWLLAGEHSVLRGTQAIVYPIKNKPLILSYNNTNNPLHVEYTGKFGNDLQLLFWGVLEYGLECINKPLKNLVGEFEINNEIQLAAGLGVSAAISSAISKWFAWKKWIPSENIYEFATKLENLFHSESSGVDIAGVMAESGLIFKRNEPTEKIIQQWEPMWFLSHTDQVGITSTCVKKVKQLWDTNQKLAKRIDNNMQDSVTLAIKALKSSKNIGLELLAKAINNANICFAQWGLNGGKVEQHINSLLQEGALAAKPTGSGNGGYVLSLWNSTPPNKIKKILEPI